MKQRGQNMDQIVKELEKEFSWTTGTEDAGLP